VTHYETLDQIAGHRVANIKLLPLPNACGDPAAPATDYSRPIELVAAIPANKTITMKARERVVIPTGLSVELPRLWEAQILPLKNLAEKSGVTVLNSPGTIDPDYRGEIMVILINHSDRQFVIKRGTPVAIMKFAPFIRAELVLTKKLNASRRSDKGLGSTGR
jgi:dUTP pyrophosphatase